MEQEEGLMPNPNELRLAANQRFAANALDEALPLYSLAVDVARKGRDPRQQEQSDAQDADLIVHLCNRSACLYKMEMYDEAYSDAAEAVGLSGEQNSKAFFRLAKAQIALKDYSSATETIKKATNYCEDQLRTQHSPSDDGDDNDNPMQLQKREFEKLLAIARRKQKQSADRPDQPPQAIKSIRLEPRTPSIKEFDRATKSSELYSPLGEGNFSAVVVCRHKVTKESFALKIIEKEECKKLAKRQHPNVYNEVAMERRVLTQNRLPRHVNIIRSYHAMQDYGNLYFLMDLHREHGDLWSKIRYQKCMVGCHSSLIRTYAYELLSALEHCHSHGIIHRDIKPENVLLSECGGHVVLIDFGTAKDLIFTDLNGPEFVGTPDFMSPQAVKEFEKGGEGCDFTADLWALGVVLYQMYAGGLPFESQSPYMGFLKIQRGVYSRNLGVWDEDAWDLISKLLKVEPKERLGAGCFEWIPPPKSDVKEAKDFEGDKETENSPDKSVKPKPLGKVVQHGKGYDTVRQHPFFSKHESAIRKQTNSHTKSDHGDKSVPQPIPSLQDLAIRATAHFIDQSSLDVDLEDLHPPGDNSFFDVLRLKQSDQRRVMHLLDRLHLLKEPRIFRRFFHSKQEARLGRVRPESRDVLGLTQINDKMGRLRGTTEDEPHPDEQLPASKLLGSMETTIHHITNPLFCKSINDKCSGKDSEAQRKGYIKQLKESVRLVNRKRPTVVIACGYFDNSCRKILSKVNETVPVILHDGTMLFNFWVYGAHCVAMPLRCFQGEGSEANDALQNEALAWFRMELEQIKTARSHGYVFVDGDARDIASAWITKMGKSHVLGLLGLCDGPEHIDGEEGSIVNKGDSRQNLRFELEFSFEDNENGKENGNGKKADECGDDYISTSSSDSDDGGDNPPDEHVMHIVGRTENGVRSIAIQDEDLVWDAKILL
mmetsp:Transcript_5435/g.11803  ORF Transcript_5435/g.11803 Transcript_5435/m.11803 type:complete len:939 (+) Transcript_5435:101-2917(+)